MKQLYTTLLFVLVFTIGGAGQVADLRIENERVENNVFKFEIAVQRLDSWQSEGLGQSDFYFSYNDDALADQPRVTNLHPSLDNNIAYDLSAQINAGLLQVKLVFSNNGGTIWSPALNLAEHLCTVEMDILDDMQNSELLWDVVNTGILTSDATVIEETFVGDGDISLPVELAFFRATFVNDVVELSWRTESEVNNWGFNIYRSASASGPFTKINSALIEGAGYSASPQHYTYVDERIQENSTYFYQLEDVDIDGNTRQFAVVQVQTGAGEAAVVKAYGLEQNYPNPFNPETTITFSLKHAEQVQLAIYDIDGRLVKRLIDNILTAGQHSVQWDGLNASGQKVPSGCYVYKLQTPGFQQSKRLTLLR